MQSPFTIQTTTKSHCGQCDQYLDLLCEAEPKYTQPDAPMFYICWNCKRVTQVGVGPVPRSE